MRPADIDVCRAALLAGLAHLPCQACHSELAAALIHYSSSSRSHAADWNWAPSSSVYWLNFERDISFFLARGS